MHLVKSIGVILVDPWIQEKQLIFKLSSIMLRYPSKEWCGNEDFYELILSIEDQKIQEALLNFWSYATDTDWETLTVNYVSWFDLSDSTTMYLTYGIFGDNRERGPAFVKLKMEYAKAGFYLKENELPDYLPLILDFVSMAEKVYAKRVLSIHYKAIEDLYIKLSEENIPYVHLLHVCMMAMESMLYTKDEKINHHAG
jgi:nitrate reductase delta subunit